VSHVSLLPAVKFVNVVLAIEDAAVVGVVLNLTVWFVLHVLFAHVAEVRAGPLRWFSPEGLDPWALALALLAGVLILVGLRAWPARRT